MIKIMKIKKTLLLFFFTAFGSLFLLSGCSLFTHPKKITVKIPKRFKYALNNENFKIKNDWWKNFKSNELDNLVSKALTNNLSYLIAIKNIQIAKTYVSQNQSGLFPTINFSDEATRSKMPGYQISMLSSGSSSGGSTVIYNLNQAGLNASYELDVWNQVNNAVKQAKANVSVSKEDAGVVKLTLISNVAQAYFQIKALNESVINLNKQYKAEKEILKLYEIQYKNGLTDAEPIIDTKTNLEILKTDLNDSIKQKDITQNTLAYYLGKFPEKFNLNVKSNIKNILNLKHYGYSNLIPPNIPSEILTRRPDVKAAEYNVLAYAYAKKESLANFFPVFNLTGSYGYASPSLDNFISNANSVWDFGLDIIAPIFNYKTNISIYKRSKLQYQQAVLNYRNTVINAFSETDSALADFQKDTQTLKSYEKNYRYALKLFNIYKVQYETGISSKITYLTYKENLLNAEYNIINQNLSVKEDVISIYNALGMGLKN